MSHAHLRNIAMAIIKSDQWESALRNTSTSHDQSTTPLRKLIRRMPGKLAMYVHSCFVMQFTQFSFYAEVAEEVFNRCSITNETKDGRVRPDSKDFQVVFNYEFLEDFVDERQNCLSRWWRSLRGYSPHTHTSL